MDIENFQKIFLITANENHWWSHTDMILPDVKALLQVKWKIGNRFYCNLLTSTLEPRNVSIVLTEVA